MITADQLLCHAIGDYVLQSDWVANNKTKSMFVAALHAAVYCLPFILLNTSIEALFVMWITHLFIDHYRIARYAVIVKNHFDGQIHIKNCPFLTKTGYPEGTQNT
jgi:hypothetical protein